MKTKNLLYIPSVVLALVLNSCINQTYVAYKPHYLSSNSEYKYYGEVTLDSAEFVHIKQVLDYYGEEYKTENSNTVLLPKKLAKQWELVWNYTTKSNDSTWLKSHNRNNKP